MQLKHLVRQIVALRVQGNLDVEVIDITYDSRRVRPGSVFVAYQGVHSNGELYIDDAIELGAVAIVSRPLACAKLDRVAFIEVAEPRSVLATLSAFLHHQPSWKLKVAGITGTNGKTTTTFLLKHILERAMLRCGLIGTVRYEIGEEISASTHTTPEASDIQNLLARMRDAGCKAAVMEVSSHAIVQGRVQCIEFDAAVFTNLTQDHLDYHQTLEEYFEAKASLFTKLLPDQSRKRGYSIINIDDRYGADLKSRLSKYSKVITYGVANRAEFRASNFKTELAGTSYQLDAQDRSFLVRMPLVGKFNVYNSLAALATATSLGVPLRTAVLALATTPAVPGRLQIVPGKRNFQVYVDYAHTEDALRNVLSTLKELNPRRLIVVFGCGGDRDRSKRALMARAAEDYSDHVVVTSDNPRSESPEAIIRDIGKGFHAMKHVNIVNRRAAIFHAIGLAQERDIVLIAGKGHENYQSLADKTIWFDDVLVAQEAMQDKVANF